MADTPRLFLITPPIDDASAFAPKLEASLDAADIACVLLRAERDIKTVAGVLAPLVQRAGAAALVETEARLAARVGADGVHVAGAGAALDAALTALKPNGIVGVGEVAGRDAAMTAGEAGVDYLMFGAPGSRMTHADVCAGVDWWAAIFNVPCVGYAAHPDLAGEIAAAGAEFVALSEGLWQPATIATTLRHAAMAIRSFPELAR